jgi:hypothetical protein
MGGTVAEFLPSTHGLHFPNDWPSVPARTFRVKVGAISATIGLGDASGGLCGGMAFTVRDLFERHLPPPPSAANPPPDSPAFDYLVDRLLASLHGLHGAALGARYYEWMVLPDRIPLVERGVADRTVHQSLPEVRRCIDAGHLAPLGLVCAASIRPHDLGQNHQVLAYAYETDATRTVLRIYDPNWPDRDDITLTCELRDSAAHPFTYSPGDHTVRGFFLSEYSPADPAALFEIAVP